MCTLFMLKYKCQGLSKGELKMGIYDDFIWEQQQIDYAAFERDVSQKLDASDLAWLETRRRLDAHDAMLSEELGF